MLTLRVVSEEHWRGAPRGSARHQRAAAAAQIPMRAVGAMCVAW
jgi:hypothetical protein